MSGIYSSRLLKVTVQSTVVEATVPAGYRMVAKQVLAMNGMPTAANVFVYVDGSPVFKTQVPGDTAVQSGQLWCVLYAGEKLGGLCTGPNMVLTVHGYLLSLSAAAAVELEVTAREPTGEEEIAAQR